jgi:hypothetical protein
MPYARRVRSAMPRRRRSASSRRRACCQDSLACADVGSFFIDTDQGTVATQRQLLEVGIADEVYGPPRPWLRIQGPSDASTMWYAVVRKQERGIFIGALALRHSSRLDLLLQAGWHEVPIEEIGP